MSTKIEVLSRRDSDAITTSLLLNDRAVFVWSGGMVSDGGPVTKMEELAASLLVSHGVRELLVSDVSTRTVVVSVMPQRYRVTPAGHDSFHSMVSGPGRPLGRRSHPSLRKRDRSSRCCRWWRRPRAT